MRLLLVKTSSLGDVIHNLPVVTDIARAFPGAVIDWVVEEAFAEIPRLHPAVRRVIPVAVRRWRSHLLSASTWRQMRAFRYEVRSEDYDVVLDTQGLLKSALIAWQAHGRRCGHAADSAREPVAARFYDARFSIPGNLHAVERNRQLASAALNFDVGGAPDYGISATPLCADWLPAEPLAVLLTATSREDKLWPEERWIALGRHLAECGFRCVFPAGSDAERERASRIARQIPGAVPAPPLSIKALAGLLAASRIAIGVDTGLIHLAAALGIPSVAIFCASTPELTGLLATSPHANLGRSGHPPAAEDVIAAIEALP